MLRQITHSRAMRKFRLIIVSMLVLISVPLSARADLDPFSKSLDINFGSNVKWKYKDHVAVKSALDNKDADTYYHLFFDGKTLRLMLSESSTDSPTSAKHYDQFAVADVQVDGRRLPLFQWCLSHQERHSRFLQQGLAVEKNICENNGDRGSFVLRLNQDTLETLQTGKQLTFIIKPFRTAMTINYELSDFPEMIAVLASSMAPKQVQSATPPAGVASVIRICVLQPPLGIEGVKPVEYNCDSESEKEKANASMLALVNKERERRKATEQENDRKHQAELAARKKAEEERLKKAQKKEADEAAIAASRAKQEAINAEITVKMLGVCSKMWAKGEHRCYCEKYIDQAPEKIRASSTCSGGG